MEIKISKMSISDLTQIKDILSLEFDNFWTYSILENELKNPSSTLFVAKLDNEIVGFAGIWQVFDEIHITNIVTKISKRHMGIGSKLLETLIKTSNENLATSITLEVNEENENAIKLYEKYNFKKIGLRQNYYGQNKNAIIMTKFIEKE